MRPGIEESTVPMDKTIEAVIFDLDGTLVDSQPAAIEATIEALSRFDVPVTAAEVRGQFGGGSRKAVGYFLEGALGLEQAGRVIDEATQLKIDLQVSFTDRVELLPGARELLVLLKESGYRLALATMAARDVVAKISNYHAIGEFFDQIMTADDVFHGKPDPEILTKTIELLGASVDRAVYVGDSFYDLDAAVLLEMPFLLVDSGLYVRGETRKKLRTTAEEKGYPIVGLEELLDVDAIIRTHAF